MTGNDQKRVWEHHLGVGAVIFGDLGCPGRYSGVPERVFDVDSQNPKVGYGGEKRVWRRKKKKNIFFQKSQNFMK